MEAGIRIHMRNREISVTGRSEREAGDGGRSRKCWDGNTVAVAWRCGRAHCSLQLWKMRVTLDLLLAAFGGREKVGEAVVSVARLLV